MTKVPAAMMRGVGAGMDDLHYGNNVKMTGGQTFTVAVMLKGERAGFRLRMPM